MIVEFVQIIVTAILVLIVLGIAIYIVVSNLYKELKRKEAESIALIIEAQERERSAISREVHDNLGPTLSITQMQVGYLMEQTKDEKMLELLSNVQKQMHQSIAMCRDISHMISPEMNREKDIRTALEEQISILNQIGKVKVHLDLDPGDFIWDPVKGTSIVRVIQELVANSINHSTANRVRVEMIIKDSILQIIYSDNGDGFVIEKVKQGMGIKNITKRISILDGKMQWNDAKLSQGMNVTILIPLVNLTLK